MSDEATEVIHTRIWQEEAEPDNAFAALSCHSHGYDIYGELLKQASWIEYLFLHEHINCDLPPSDFAMAARTLVAEVLPCGHKKVPPSCL